MKLYKTEISNLENGTTWAKKLNEKEFYELMENSDVKRDVIAMIPATLIPVRTDTLKNFSKDLFLPTTINHAIKVQHTVGKVFAILGSLVLDLFTLPIRLITAIPRAIENARREEHPLHKYLSDQAVDPKLIEAGYVRTEFTITEFDSNKDYQAKKVEKGFYNVNFIELPTYENYGYIDHTTTMKADEITKVNKLLTILN